MERHRIFIDDSKSMRMIARAAAKKANKPLNIFKNNKAAAENIMKLKGQVDVVAKLITPLLSGIGLAKMLEKRKNTDIFLCSSFPDNLQDDIELMAKSAGISEVIRRERMMDALIEIGIECSSFKVFVHNKRMVTTEVDKDVIIVKRPVNLMSLMAHMAGKNRVFIETDTEKIKCLIKNELDNFGRRHIVVDDLELADTVFIISHFEPSIQDVNDFLRDYSIFEKDNFGNTTQLDFNYH